MVDKRIKVDAITFWRALEGKTVAYERIGYKFLGCDIATVGELSPTKSMVYLSGKWFELKTIKVKDIMK